MKSTLFVTLLVFVACARANEAGACALTGELRCADDGARVMTCARDGAWHSVRDCSDTHEMCVNGRCVFGAYSRAASCKVVGEHGCSDDCEYVETCSANGVWVTTDKCREGTLCFEGSCVSSSQHICRTTGQIKCGDGSTGVTFPNLEDCSSYYMCDSEWATPTIQYCNTGYYDPCSGDCSLTSPTPCKRYKPCNETTEGLDAAITENPALHYTCTDNTTIFKKCSKGYYDALEGECIGTGSLCQA